MFHKLLYLFLSLTLFFGRGGGICFINKCYLHWSVRIFIFLRDGSLGVSRHHRPFDPQNISNFCHQNIRSRSSLLSNKLNILGNVLVLPSIAYNMKLKIVMKFYLYHKHLKECRHSKRKT